MTLQDFDIEESSSIDHQLICHSVIAKVKYSHRLMHLQAKHKASLTKHLERQRICGFHTNTNTQVQKYTITRQRVHLPKNIWRDKGLVDFMRDPHISTLPPSNLHNGADVKI